MVKYDEANINKQLNILGELVTVNPKIKDTIEANQLIRDGLIDIKQENNLDNYSIKVFVDDNSKKKWKVGSSNPNVFVKVFFNEIEYAKDRYELTNTEVSFLYSISGYLLWGYNLLVDKDGLPLNQKRLMEALGYKKTAISGLIKNLYNKKCMLKVWDKRETYFLINPYLMWFGNEINKELPELFTLNGYIPMSKSNKK